MSNNHFPNPARILIVCPSWIGDMVMAQSLFKHLKARNPNVTLDALAAPWSLPLLNCMPEIQSVINMPIGHGELKMGKRRDIAHSLSQNNYDQAILLPNSFKSALIPWLAGIPCRTGWLGEMRWGLLNDPRRLNKTKLSKTVQRFVALAQDKDDEACPPCPEPALQVDATAAQNTQKQFDLSHQKKILVLCPGAEYGPSKRWPAKRFGQLAATWNQDGGQTWLLGSKKDRPICHQVIHTAGNECHDLSGKTSLRQAIELISLADAVVSNDSGLMHVAAALNKPLVAIYGSTDPNHTPPMNQRHQILYKKLDCSPCFERQCQKKTNACMNEITVDQTYVALKNSLKMDA